MNLHLCTFFDPAQEMEEEGAGRRKRNTLPPTPKDERLRTFFYSFVNGSRAAAKKKRGVVVVGKEKETHSPHLLRVFFRLQSGAREQICNEKTRGKSSPTSFFCWHASRWWRRRGFTKMVLLLYTIEWRSGRSWVNPLPTPFFNGGRGQEGGEMGDI